MASDSCFLSEDHFLCSICLDLFSEPVSIPCGHNFCHACISTHWEGKQQRQCPLCKESSDAELRLCVNTAFREIVEDFKTHCQETSGDASPTPAPAPALALARPGQVPCDCCLGSKFRASKTCLVCLASYCEIHLEPHQTVEALKRHTLTDPVLNLEDKICTKHNRMLELFCRDDLTCVCVLCTDHSDHDVVALEKAFVNKKGHAAKKKAAIKSRKCGKQAQRSKAGERPKRSDGTTPNGGVSNQLPHIWWRPAEGAQEQVGRLSVGTRAFWYDIQARHWAGWRLTVVSESVSGLYATADVHQNGPCYIGFHDPGRAPPSEPVQLFLVKTPDGVWVLLDYESDVVSIHHPQTDILFYSLKGSKFVKSYHLCFIPMTTRIDTPQLLSMVQIMKACLPAPSNSNYCMFMVCGFLFFLICMSFLQA